MLRLCLLISDVHKLFDTGYPTITNNHKTEVSERIKEEFKNCKEYYQFPGSFVWREKEVCLHLRKIVNPIKIKKIIMKKFLITASYNEDGVKGLLKVGGTNRKEAVGKMITEMGGKLEVFYFAFGDYDVYAIAELPDITSAAALALTINASGLVNLSTTVLLTPEEVDNATKMSVNYRPPGN